MEVNPHPEMAVAGSGAIATGLAALASAGSERVWLLARSEQSAEKARDELESTCPRVDGGDFNRVRVTTGWHHPTRAASIPAATPTIQATEEKP